MNSINSITTNRYSQNVQFKGFLPLKRVPLKQRQANSEIISNILSVDKSEIFNLTKNTTDKKLYFLKHLTDKYNQRNYYRNIEDRDDTQLISKIYKAVKSPRSMHHDLISHFHGSLDSLSRVFVGIKNNKQALEFAQKVNRDILINDPKAYTDLLPELLESENSKEYIKYYDKYKSYLKLNKENKDAVKNLDYMVKSGTYSQEKYDNLYQRENLRAEFFLPETENFNSNIFAENYSESGRKFLDYLSYRCYLDKDMLEAGADKILLDMFKSCTKDNYKLRIDLAQSIGNLSVSKVDPDVQIKQMQELNNLYNVIDNDKYAKKFVGDVVQNTKVSGALSVNSLNQILSLVPTVKLAIFSENARNIIGNTVGRERLEAFLTELENPFFETRMSRINNKIAEKYGFQKPQTRFSKFVKSIKNRINILRYQKYKNLEKPVDIDSIMAEEVKVPEVKPKVVKLENNKPDTESIIEAKETVIPESKEELNIAAAITEDVKKRIKDVKALLSRPVNYREMAESYITLKPTREKHNRMQFLYDNLFGQEISTPQTRARVANIASKLQAPLNYSELIENLVPKTLTEEQYNIRYKELEKVFSSKNITKQNVLLYIQKKLGVKTLETQKDSYQARATKMKLAMLPEIFASIADTRKADRLVGKKRINSSNKDALDLYLLINGNNRKYINYLLKKRNADNTRMFEVKDIIDMVRKAESKITEQKTKNSHYRSSDAKAYYNHLYDSKVQQYGKVKKQKRINTEA